MREADELNLFLIFGVIFFAVAALGATIHVLAGRGTKRKKLEREMEKPAAMPTGYRDLLMKHFPFYRQLSQANRNRFDHRLLRLVAVKHVERRGLNDPDDVVAPILFASLVQVSFGLPAYLLPHITTIIVTSEDDADLPDRAPQEVSPSHIMKLSWKQLTEGVTHFSDGHAPGLNRMAHALYIQNFIRNQEHHFFPDKALMKWRKAAEETLKEIRSRKQSFLRPSAGASMHALFAASVEYFFEQPKAFSLAHPELFQALREMLNLDPLNVADPVMDMQRIWSYEAPEERAMSESPLPGI